MRKIFKLASMGKKASTSARMDVIPVRKQSYLCCSLGPLMQKVSSWSVCLRMMIPSPARITTTNGPASNAVQKPSSSTAGPSRTAV